MNNKAYYLRSGFIFFIILGMHKFIFRCFLTYSHIWKMAGALLMVTVWILLLTLTGEKKKRKKTQEEKREMGANRLYFLLLWMITIAAVLFYIKMDLTRLVNDVRLIIDAAKFKYDLYFHYVSGTFSIQSYHGSNGSRALFLFESLVIWWMHIFYPKRHGLFWGSLPMIALFCGGLLVGASPGILEMFFVLGGLLGIRLISESRTKKMNKIKNIRECGRVQFKESMLSLFVILCISAFLTVALSDLCLSNEKKLLYFQHNMEEKVTETAVRWIQNMQILIGAQNSGLMTNIAPKYTGKKVMKITVSKKPTQSIYLKGFIGTDYQNGCWRNQTDHILKKKLDQEQCYSLMCMDYNWLRDYLDSNHLSEKEELIQISYLKGAIRKQCYFPYYSYLSDDSMGLLHLDGDRGFERDSSVKEIKAVSDDYILSSYDVLLKNGDILQKGMIPYCNINKNKQLKQVFPIGSGRLIPESQLQDASKLLSAKSGEKYVSVAKNVVGQYYQYVLQADTQLPTKGLEKTKKLAQEIRNSYIDQNKFIYFDKDTLDSEEKKRSEWFDHDMVATDIVNEVQKYLSSNMKYSLQLQEKAAENDYVEDFLFRTKKGYCEHFATAGTLLLRGMGIPSRFASGYIVPANRFEKNEDGTYTATVVDSDGHAWSEVMILNGGWTPVEMTMAGSNGAGDTANGEDSSESLEDEVNDLKDEEEQKKDQDASDDSFLKDSDDEKINDPETKVTATPKPKNDNSQGSQEENQNVDSQDSPASDQADSEKNPYLEKILSILSKILAVMGILLLLYLLRESQRIYRRWRIARCKNSDQRILERNHLLEKCLASFGCGAVAAMTDEEYRKLLEEIYPKGKENGEMDRYFSVLASAKFARGNSKKEDEKFSEEMVCKIGEKLWKKKGVLPKLYAVVIRHWKKTLV